MTKALQRSDPFVLPVVLELFFDKMSKDHVELTFRRILHEVVFGGQPCFKANNIITIDGIEVVVFVFSETHIGNILYFKTLDYSLPDNLDAADTNIACLSDQALRILALITNNTYQVFTLLSRPVSLKERYIALLQVSTRTRY